jgi:hypothetical protein
MTGSGTVALMVVAASCVVSGVLFVRFGRRSAPLTAMLVLAASVAVALPATAAADDCVPERAPAAASVTTTAGAPAADTTVAESEPTVTETTVAETTVPSSTETTTTSTTTTTTEPAPAPIIRNRSVKGTVGDPFSVTLVEDASELPNNPASKSSPTPTACVDINAGAQLLNLGLITGELSLVGVCVVTYSFITATGVLVEGTVTFEVVAEAP